MSCPDLAVIKTSDRAGKEVRNAFLGERIDFSSHGRIFVVENEEKKLPENGLGRLCRAGTFLYANSR
jgi:hypothetical protein